MHIYTHVCVHVTKYCNRLQRVVDTWLSLARTPGSADMYMDSDIDSAIDSGIGSDIDIDIDIERHERHERHIYIYRERETHMYIYIYIERERCIDNMLCVCVHIICIT